MSTFNIEALEQSDTQGPVAMLNLLKYRDREAYQEYGRLTAQLVTEHGGQLIWAGAVSEVALGEHADTDWDLAAVVLYPSRQAFVDLVTSPKYVNANEFRRKGVSTHLVLAAETVQFQDIVRQPE